MWGLALHDLEEDTECKAAGPVMAILGGALMPLVRGALIDSVGAAMTDITPAICLVIVTASGLFDFVSETRI